LFKGPAFAIGPGGTGMFITVHDPVSPSGTIPDPIVQKLSVKEPPYLIWSVISTVEGFLSDPGGLESDKLQEEALRLIKCWHENFRHMVRESMPSSAAYFRFWFPNNLKPWSSGRITLIGDAHPSYAPYRRIRRQYSYY
jgi:salicylate hydroxylase